MKLHTEELLYKSSRIKIVTDRKDFIGKAYDELVKQRSLIEKFIESNKLFEVTLEPMDIPRDAPTVVRLMAKGGKIADVGPMAAVAGAIAELVVKRMVKEGSKVAVADNGGDIFAITDRPITVGIFSGENKLSGKLAFKLNKKNTPISICSSSSFLGHSLSFGKCDLATVFSKRGHIADAVVTAVCNRVKKEEDVSEALEWGIERKGVDGVMIIKGGKIGMIGKIPPLIKSEDKKIKEKIVKDDLWVRTLRT